MKNLKSHFLFNKQQRSGIFFLLLVIVVLQLLYHFYLFEAKHTLVVEEDEKLQRQIDSLDCIRLAQEKNRNYQFNPNFISDYKGYTLGMSLQEIDRLHQFRATNKYVNSNKEFQQVTKISDSLLNSMSALFRFPKWKTKNRTSIKNKPKIIAAGIDINKATALELQMINGVGLKLSARIVKFRDRLGGFLVKEQLYDVYGLSLEVADMVIANFPLLSKPVISKININTASVKEISSLIYINYATARNIVEYRALNGGFKAFEELLKIEGFHSEKIDRIQLYLSL